MWHFGDNNKVLKDLEQLDENAERDSIDDTRHLKHQWEDSRFNKLPYEIVKKNHAYMWAFGENAKRALSV